MSEEVKGTKLYVGNIEYRTTRKEIEDLFKDCNVTGIEIPTNTYRKRGRGGKPSTFSRAKGYVFVTFDKNESEIEEIITKFTDSEFKERKIYLRHLNPKQEKSEEEVKPKKERIPFDQGEKSTNTLYLKNLDFSVKSEDLKAFFEQEGETALWISVPLLKLPGFVLKKLQAKNNNNKLERRNKGFAFVKLDLKDGESIEDKVAKFNGKSFKDRELLASIAIDVRQPKEASESESKTEIETKTETETEIKTEA